MQVLREVNEVKSFTPGVVSTVRVDHEQNTTVLATRLYMKGIALADIGPIGVGVKGGDFYGLHSGADLDKINRYYFQKAFGDAVVDGYNVLEIPFAFRGMQNPLESLVGAIGQGQADANGRLVEGLKAKVRINDSAVDAEFTAKSLIRGKGQPGRARYLETINDDIVGSKKEIVDTNFGGREVSAVYLIWDHLTEAGDITGVEVWRGKEMVSEMTKAETWEMLTELDNPRQLVDGLFPIDMVATGVGGLDRISVPEAANNQKDQADSLWFKVYTTGGSINDLRIVTDTLGQPPETKV